MNEFPANCPTCGDPLPSSGCRHCPKCLFLTTMGATELSPVGAGAPWTRMGGMELHEEIGRGGMGVVYRARQTKLDRIVAVKVLLGARFAGEEERARFLREAKAAAQLDHPGIVRMFDIGEEDGTLWFSMEHVPGRNMEEDLRLNGQPDPREAAESVAGLADAVAHAHARGILHRDLKPSNILIDESGHHRITDFGIARLAGPGEDADGLTRSGQMLGSPGYASPEQVLFGRADPRTDVYGLGAILYHLFTGNPPFSGPTLESVVLQLRENEPIRPRVFHTSLHRDLETICLKCLRKNPATRYANAAEVAADLRRYLAGKPILARPPGAWERTWMWIARHPVVAVLLLVVFLLTGGLVTTSLWYARDKTLSEHRSSLLAEARSLRQSRLAGSKTGALEKLKAAWEIRPSREILDETVATLALPELEFAGHSLPPASDQEQRPDEVPALELDGNFALTRERNSGKLIARFPLPGPAACLATDEAGKVLAFAAPNSGELRLLSPGGRETGKIHHPLPVEDVALAGELIATSCANRFIYIWDKMGNLKHRLSGHDAPAIRIAFRPRTQILASTSADPNIRLWHAARGEEILRLEHAHAAHATLEWSPDGNHLIGTSSNGEHDVYRMRRGEIIEVLSPPQEEPHSENPGSADFHADGRFALSIDELTGRLWDF